MAANSDEELIGKVIRNEIDSHQTFGDEVKLKIRRELVEAVKKAIETKKGVDK